MNQNLENLKKYNDDEFKDYSDLHYFVKYYCIPILEGFEKRLKEIESKIGLFPLGNKEKKKAKAQAETENYT